MSSPRDPRPLIAHLIYRLGLGGMEHGLVNLVNHTPPGRYRHAIISLTDITDFAARIRNPDVSVHALAKAPGQDFRVYGTFWTLLRRLRPDLLHTRNLGPLEFQAVAAAAGIRARVHGEHGRDSYDLDGTNFRYNLLRKGIRPFVHHYTTVSRDLAQWLVKTIRVRPDRITQIDNGVDTGRFRPDLRAGDLLPPGFLPPSGFVVGSVGRMEMVKGHRYLVQAFLDLATRSAEARARLRLVLVGHGSEYAHCLEAVRQANAENLVWMPGERSDIPALMRSFHLFALPSLGEGISNTVLEAMASGLPVLATLVGGNSELVDPGATGTLVPPSDPAALAAALESYLQDPALALRQGRQGRSKVEARFSIDAMVRGYSAVYDRVLRGRGFSLP